MKNMKKANKGFTLVELIVVVTILAILATIAFLTLGTYTGDTRDSKRVAQSRSLFNKIEITRAKNGASYESFLKGTPTAETALKGNTITTLKKWELDFTKIGESETAFKLPVEGEKYVALVGHTDATAGKDARDCMVILTYDETSNGTSGKTTPGHKNINSTGNCLDTDLKLNDLTDANAKALFIPN